MSKLLWVDATPPSVVTLTVTGLATLASGASVTSAVIDNHTNLDFDIYLTSKISYTTTLATASVAIYVEGSTDNSTFADGSAPNDKLLGTLAMPVQATLYINMLNLLSAWPVTLGLPPYLKVRYVNNAGTALTAATVTYNGYVTQ